MMVSLESGGEENGRSVFTARRVNIILLVVCILSVTNECILFSAYIHLSWQVESLQERMHQLPSQNQVSWM